MISRYRSDLWDFFSASVSFFYHDFPWSLSTMKSGYKKETLYYDLMALGGKELVTSCMQTGDL